MADRWWIGAANDGDWNNTANWSASRFGAGGAAAPVDGDSVYIWDTAQAITANLNQTGINLVLLDIRFDGVIGTASTALTIGVSSGSTPEFIYSGSGAFCNITAGDDGIDVAYVRRAAGVFRAAGGAWADIYFGRVGTFEIEAAATISSSIYCAGMRGTIRDNASDFYLFMGGPSSIDNYRPLKNVVVGHGSVLRNWSDVDIDTTIDVLGTLEHNSSGTIADIQAYPTAVCTSNGRVRFTVTAGRKYEGAKVFEENPNITYTAALKLVGETR